MRSAHPWRRLGVAATASVLAHLLVFGLLSLAGPPLPSIELEFNDDLEFGAATELIAIEALPPPSSTAPEPEIPEVPASTGPEPMEDPIKDAGAPDVATAPDTAPDVATAPDTAPDVATATDTAPEVATAPDVATATDTAPEGGPATDTAPEVATAPDAAPEVATATAADALMPTSAPPIPGLAAAPPSGTIALPAGAQVALRLDMALIRLSPLADEVRALFRLIPDWQLLLDGSGVDPVNITDRVLIASSGLRRDRMVLAGSLTDPDPAIVRHAVATLAKARGQTAPWTQLDGYEIAPWTNMDATPRHVALLDAKHFVVSRLEDLPAILALAQARVAAAAAAVAPVAPPPDATATDATATAPASAVSGPEALLWMPPLTALSIDIDGARRIIRAPSRFVPERLRLALSTLPEERVLLELEGEFIIREEAEAAAMALVEFRARALNDPMTYVTLRLLALDANLRGLTFEVRTGDDDVSRLYTSTTLHVQQIRSVLMYSRAKLEASQRTNRPPGPPPPPPPSSPASGPLKGKLTLTPLFPRMTSSSQR